MEIGNRSPHQANRSAIFIAKGLQNRQSNLFQLFNNVPWLSPTRSAGSCAEGVCLP